ncbi:Sugar tr and/or MFS 1 domain containing protein [Asbolus verrucosus]|uniref:Sugar tr and/or MFS 1 domain containing protein n=1 Tax=Asbolus verrucosus TaxID=1661398 RepID=A0A482VMV9_ASBVE|nr:Sugar tr and/or MFS 1 domain containing protein [Asbolus verrucosus]
MSVLNSRLLTAILISTLGSGFQHGYHTGIINIPENIFRDWIFRILARRVDTVPDERDVNIIWSTTIAMFSVGGMLGGFLTSFFTNKCGCKGSLIWNNLIVVLGICILTVSQRVTSFELFMVGRFLVGINAGLNSGLCQMYLVDIAPLHIRGAVAGFYQLVITLGILLSHCSSCFLGTAEAWPFMFVIALLPAAFQLLSLPFCPESPKYLLITKEDETKAEKALQWLRKTTDVQHEMEQLKEEDNLVKELRPVTLKRMFTDVSLRSPLVVCLVLMFGQQLCGINAISIYFSTETFKEIGLEDRHGIYLTMSMGLLNVLATFLTLPLIDIFGRRTMLLTGFMGLSLDTIALTITLVLAHKEGSAPFLKYLSIIFEFVFVLFFSPGIGTIPWFITAEIFHHTARTLGVSIAVIGNWFANYIVSQTFNVVKVSIRWDIMYF